MCNGLAVDLKAAVEARADAEDDREALVQVIAAGCFGALCGACVGRNEFILFCR